MNVVPPLPPPPDALTFRLTVLWISVTPSSALKVTSWLKVLVGRPVMKPDSGSRLMPGGERVHREGHGPVCVRRDDARHVLGVGAAAGSASVRKRKLPFAPRSQTSGAPAWAPPGPATAERNRARARASAAENGRPRAILPSGGGRVFPISTRRLGHWSAPRGLRRRILAPTRASTPRISLVGRGPHFTAGGRDPALHRPRRESVSVTLQRYTPRTSLAQSASPLAERRATSGAQRMAIARSGAPLPPSIFIGRAITQKSRGGRSSRFERFSKTGTPCAASARWASKAREGPGSMLAVSSPTAAIPRSRPARRGVGREPREVEVERPPPRPGPRCRDSARGPASGARSRCGAARSRRGGSAPCSAS